VSHAYVERILERTLSDWAAAQTPVIPIAWQNVAFTPPVGARWIAAHVLPAAQEAMSLDGELETFEGVFQVTINLHVGQGLGEARTLADSLIASFPTTAVLPLVISLVTVMRLFITRPMRRGPALSPTGGFVPVPVSCSYRADSI
jgi:hypothetical protein